MGNGASMTRGKRSGLRLDWWIGWLRLAGMPLVVYQIAISLSDEGLHWWGWLVGAAYLPGAVALFWAARRHPSPLLGLASLVFDLLILSGYALVYAHQPGLPARQLLFLVVVEGSVRYGVRGALAAAIATIPSLAAFEWLRQEALPPFAYRWINVVFQFGVELVFGLVVGWLVAAIAAERQRAEARAAEAESLRDELGRRADLLDAVNRCARALSSSLDLDEAFGAFIRELNGLVPFERVAIVTAEGDVAHTLASAGAGEAAVYPAGTRTPVAGSLLAEIVATGQTIERPDLDPPRYPEEEDFLRLGLRCRVAAPVLAGVRPVGMLSLSRRRPAAFSPHEVELLTLLGRLVGSAVQNIRAYESERATVEELRRLSALRADFVSLVSHELRSPMAAVIGSARTLQQRWRELSPEQRSAFLALIADETSRLATLVGDVLDTSRIEAGTFSYRFSDVDLAALLRDAVATAALGQDEVPVDLQLQEPLPHLRADKERLRQIVANLLDNAIKYSPAGAPVEVRARPENGSLLVTVRDSGPGVPDGQQRLIFEKFGRADGGAGKPGTGLGLFIARSIAEAHGGTLEVRSKPGEGSIFTLALPVED